MARSGLREAAVRLELEALAACRPEWHPRRSPREGSPRGLVPVATHKPTRWMPRTIQSAEFSTSRLTRYALQLVKRGLASTMTGSAAKESTNASKRSSNS